METVELDRVPGLELFRIIGDNVDVAEFTIAFGDEFAWSSFRSSLVAAKGKVSIGCDIYDHWKMISWEVDDNSFSRVPLGRLWPHKIIAQGKWAGTLTSIKSDIDDILQTKNQKEVF